MSRKSCISFLLLLSTCVLLADHAQAWPWRRSRGYRYQTNYSYNYSYHGGSTYSQVARTHDHNSAYLPSLWAYYDYNRAGAEEVAFSDKLRVFLMIQDQKVLDQKDPIVAKVKISPLDDARTTDVKWCPVSVDHQAEGAYKPGVFEVTNGKDESIVKPAKVYRLFVTLHREAEEQGDDTALGRISGPYYVATGGADRLDRARQQIVMRTFKEWYYIQQGWAREGNYPMDCHAYYRWATGFCTVGSTGGWANLGVLFGGYTPYHNGSQIPALTNGDAIHGDYVRMPGHTFMLLAYDAQNHQVWTMEGNFNSSIAIAVRSVSPGWTVGHLHREHIRPELFQIAADDMDGEQPVAAQRDKEAEQEMQ